MIKYWIGFLLLAFLVQSCDDHDGIDSSHPIHWKKRTVSHELSDSLTHGMTYLSVYSEIYSQSEQRTNELTSTVSIRNTDLSDTLFIKSARYFDTEGNLIKTYFDKAVFVTPMETLEIIVDKNDEKGGTGANFLFEWAIEPNTNEPLFEGVMISTSGQQGLSFTTSGKRTK